MVKPASSVNSRSSSAETLSPPEMHSRSEPKSSFVAAWSRTKLNSAAGNMQRNVGCVSRSSGSSSSPSMVLAMTTRAPAARLVSRGWKAC